MSGLPAAADDTLEPAVLLRLMRLASPSLPVGGFSYSEGLEAAVEHGLVGDEAATLAWLSDQLRHALVPSELAVVARAAEAWRRDDLDAIAALNDWQIVSREARELRQQSEQMGRSLAQWLRHLDPPEPRLADLEALTPAPSWPVAFALAGVATGAPVRAITLAFAAGWAEAMVQAALKAVPLGQSAGPAGAGRPGAGDSGRGRGGARHRTCGDAGVHADARHPRLAARGPVLAPVPILSPPPP
jgi:urease accessory protein